MSSGFILCVFVTLLHVRNGVGDNAFGYTSQSAWVDYYTQKNQLSIPDNQKTGTKTYSNHGPNVYQLLSQSHLRLDCNPPALDWGQIPINKVWPVTDFPMCEILMKRVILSIYIFNVI